MKSWLRATYMSRTGTIGRPSPMRFHVVPPSVVMYTPISVPA
jgi:hypothetical protein